MQQVHRMPGRVPMLFIASLVVSIVLQFVLCAPLAYADEAIALDAQASPLADATSPFSDVRPSTAHFEDIIWLNYAQVTTGYDDGTFRPMKPVARQDMAAFLFRVAKLEGLVDDDWFPSHYYANTFNDVDMDTPHAIEIWWLATTGISMGYEDGSFRPTSPVTRQDMAAFLFRLANLAGKGGASDSWMPTDAQQSAFMDVDLSTSHSREIWWLASANVSTGYNDGTFRPMQNVCRQDMAAFLHRLFNIFAAGNKVGVYYIETAHSSDWELQPSYSLEVTSQKGDDLAFNVSKLGPNGSPLIEAKDNCGTLDDEELSFSWTDSWSNYGDGHLDFYGPSVIVTMKVIERAPGSRSTLETDDEGLTLVKVSNVPRGGANPSC